jgi:hypothetical protein
MDLEGLFYDLEDQEAWGQILDPILAVNPVEVEGPMEVDL